MSLSEYFKSKGVFQFEGYSQEVPQQVIDLYNLTTGKTRIMEIGFNGGHSSEIFLLNSKENTVTSFDLGYHRYVSIGKEYIDATYQGRHTLYLGNSKISIPTFIKNTKDDKFDLIFIDGGHEYDVAMSDLENCRHLAHENTIVIMDDTMYKEDWIKSWNIGPTKAWTEYLNNNMLIEIGRKDYCDGRGMSWGKYVFSN